jgi:hypothetical protein
MPGLLFIVLFSLVLYLIGDRMERRYSRRQSQLVVTIRLALREGEKHSYQLAKWLRANYPDVLKTSDIPIFLALWHMEERGELIRRTDVDPVTHRTHWYYRLAEEVPIVQTKAQ